MTTTLDNWLTAVKSRLDKCTPGPWEPKHGPKWSRIIRRFPDGSETGLASKGENDALLRAKKNDINLIAAAPTDLKKALRIIELYKARDEGAMPFISADEIAAMTEDQIWRENEKNNN